MSDEKSDLYLYADVKKINDDLLLYAPEQVQVNKEEARTSSNVRSWLSK